MGISQVAKESDLHTHSVECPKNAGDAHFVVLVFGVKLKQAGGVTARASSGAVCINRRGVEAGTGNVVRGGKFEGEKGTSLNRLAVVAGESSGLSLRSWRVKIVPGVEGIWGTSLGFKTGPLPLDQRAKQVVEFIALLPPLPFLLLFGVALACLFLDLGLRRGWI